MSTKTIDGKCYARMLLGGAAMLALHIKELNALNVFPVSDGDTGTNMLKTIEGGLSEVDQDSCDHIGELSKQFSKGVLLSARGNSGVILSQIFAGISDVLEEYESATALTLAKAYRHGIEKSYAAVQNPVEGTILTVFRESTEYAAERMDKNSTLEDFFCLHIKEAKRSLETTKDLLPVLKEADVVDSGAAGYLYIAEGMHQALGGKEVVYELSARKKESDANIDLFTRDSVLKYGYCTEFLLRLTNTKCDPDSFEISAAIAILKEMGGESIVAYKQDDIIKVHVHTFAPGEVLAKMQSFGEFLTVKVENMNLGHTESEKNKHKINKEYAVIAVAQGEGIAALFEDMGADIIVAGGQSCNPSIEDFMEAFKQCETKDIIVLPNNKNMILAANQAAQIYADATVHVVHTKNIAQGYSALSVITPGIKDIASLVKSAEHAASTVIDGEITRAVRDATVNGKKVTSGDYIAISEGNIIATADTPEDAVLSMLSSVDIDLCEIMTIFVGANVSENSRAALTETLKKIYDGYEIVVYDGGQELYDYFVAIE